VIKVPDVLENKVIRTQLLAECCFCCDIAEKKHFGTWNRL